MPLHAGDEIAPGYEIERFMPGGPLSERYVVRDGHGVDYEIEVLPRSVDSPQVSLLAYRSLLFVAGVKHPCLPESQGTISIPANEDESGPAFREVPLWEHAAGRLTLNQLVESIGCLHPAQAVEIMLDVCGALLAIDRASRNSNGNPFPHLALSPANIALREDRVPVVLGWGNRAAFLAEVRPPLHQNRFISFLDPIRPAGGCADRRHDVYALACSLFYLVKGFPPPYQLNVERAREDTDSFQAALAPILGEAFAAFLARAIKPNLGERPSVEGFARELAAVQSELEAAGHEGWRRCAACGLMMLNDADLCPLCIRDDIVACTDLPAHALAAPEIPVSLSFPPYGAFAGLEELAAALPRMVRDASYAGSRRELDRVLRAVLLYLAGNGFREFIGDLVGEDGALTDAPYSVAAELAHRIAPEAADEVELAREKGAFLRWLHGREGSRRYRKSLRTDFHANGVFVDMAFRGRLYLFRPTADVSTLQRVRRLARSTGMPIVLVSLRGTLPPLSSELAGRVSAYVRFPPQRLVPRRLFGWLDEYRFFSFVRGSAAAEGRR